MKSIKLIVSAMLLTLVGTTASAQTITSPYSRLGMGILGDNATGIQRSMGGVGIAMQNGRQINVMNPASYSQVDSLTFLWDIGLDLTNSWSTEGSKHGYNLGGGLDYITMEFRLAKNLGAAIGIVPFSSVGYTFGGEIENGLDSRTGSGGLSELFAGVGYQPFKGLSIGANFSYLFGSTTNITAVSSTSNTQFSRYLNVKDWNMKVGLQYAFMPSRKSKVVIGATYSPKKAMHGDAWGTIADIDLDKKADTVGYMKLKGNYELPATYGVGVSCTYDNRLNIEADYIYQQWSKAKYTPIDYFEDPNTKWNDRWKVSAGVSYTHDHRGSYLKRMTYRMGGFYNNDYMNVNGNKVRDYGVGIGFSFPALNTKTIVNLGVEWKHRYTVPVNLIKEDYLNITLSVNFNEMWFWKNKIR